MSTPTKIQHPRGLKMNALTHAVLVGLDEIRRVEATRLFMEGVAQAQAVSRQMSTIAGVEVG